MALASSTLKVCVVILATTGGLAFLLAMVLYGLGVAADKVRAPGKRSRLLFEHEKVQHEAQVAAMNERKALHEARAEMLTLPAPPEKKAEAIHLVEEAHKRESR